MKDVLLGLVKSRKFVLMTIIVIAATVMVALGKLSSIEWLGWVTAAYADLSVLIAAEDMAKKRGGE